MAERDFEEKAEELKVQREEKEVYLEREEEEGVFVTPEYRRRGRSIYRREEREEQTVLRNLKEVTNQVRDVVKSLAEFGKVVQRVHRGMIEVFGVFEEFGDVAKEETKKFDRIMKRGSEEFRKRFDRIGRSMARLDDQFKVFEELVEDVVKVKRKEREGIEKVEKLRKWYLEDLSFRELLEVQKRVATVISSGAEGYKVVMEAVQKEMQERVLRPLRKLEVDRELRKVGFAVLGPIGGILHEFVEEVGGVRQAMGIVKESFLASGRLVSNVFSRIFKEREVEEAGRREGIKQRLDWQVIRERREMLRKERGVARERRVRFLESFVPAMRVVGMGAIGSGLGLVGRELRPAEMYLTQERGAVFETDKLYVQAREIIAEGLIGGGGFLDWILGYLGLRAIITRGKGALGVLGKWLGELGRRVLGVLGELGKWLGELGRRVLGGLGRWLGRFGGVAGLKLGAGYMGWRGYKERGIGYGLARGAGFLGGGAAGAIIGSKIAPGIGTVVGGVLGSVLGGKLGGWLYEVFEKIDFKKFKDAISKFTDLLVQLVHKLGEIIGKLGERVNEGIGTVKKEAIDVMKWIGEKIGVVARSAEAGEIDLQKASALIGRTVGDIGRVSYGAYQIASGTGTLVEFLNWMSKDPRFKKFADELRKYRPGTREFDLAWKNLAKQYREFGEAQHEFIMQTHFAPVISKLEQLGMKQWRESRALQEMFFARAVQQRWQVITVFKRAFAAMTPEQIAKLSPQEIIQRYYSELIRNVDLYFKSSSPKVRQALVKRWREEEKILLTMLRYEKGGLMDKELAKLEEARAMDREIRREGARVPIREEREERKEVAPVAVTGYTTGEAFERVPIAIDDIGILLLQLGLV